MVHKMKKIILLFFCVFYTATASAEEYVKVNFTGTVTDATCEIQTDSENPEINLGDLYNKDLADAGSASDWVTFNITLLNCPAGLNNVIAKFSGEADASDASLYRNTGDAINVAVELQDLNTQAVLKNGASDSAVILSSRQAVFNLEVRARTAVGNVTAGTIESLIEMTYSYN